MAPSLFPQDTITLGLRGWPQRAELVRETVTSALNLPTQTTPYISGLLQALTLITSPPQGCVCPCSLPPHYPPCRGAEGEAAGKDPTSKPVAEAATNPIPPLRPPCSHTS